MFRKIIATTLMATLLGTAVPAFAVSMIKEVDVSVDLKAIENPKAAAYWTAISDDLENAIVALLTERIAEDGAKISVDINEVELANTFQSAMNIADSKLVGNVTVTHDNNNTVFDAYELTVTVAEASPFLPEGTDLAMIKTDSKEHYDAMISAFAARVVADLK